MELKTDNKKTEMTFHGSMDLASYIQDHHLGNSVSHEINHSFCPYTWDETKEAFLNGWTESEKIKINADSIDIMGDQASYGIEYDVTGDYIDMGACISGIPECWGNIIEEPKAMKKAKVLVDFCAGSSVTPEQIENRGSAIIAMVDGLRNAGYYLEITISMLSIDNTYNGKDFQLNLIFETDNGYSRDVMAFCVAHPGMLRRITFAANEETGYTVSVWFDK